MNGRILDLTGDAYHQDAVDDRPSLNSSIAKILLAQSPLHAKWAHPKLSPRLERKDEKKFDIGTAVHRLLLEPERADLIAVAPEEFADWRRKAAAEFRDDARADGYTPLLATEWTRVNEMLAAVREQLPRLDVAPIPFTAGSAERTIVWEDPRTEVLCRARLDWLHDDHATVDDGKSTGYSADPLLWGRRTLWSIGADVQASWYRRAVEAITGHKPDLRFVVMETTAPYAVSVIALSDGALRLADQKVDAALDAWKRCLESDVWPGYPPAVIEAEAPAWTEMDFVERQQLAEEMSA